MSKKINKGYLHEAMDRTVIIANNLEDYVVSNKAVKRIPRAKKKIRKALTALFEAYQELGQYM